MRHLLQIALAGGALLCASDVQAQMRFQGMDRNNDGIITRSEWRGNDQSFRNQDWNGDAVLSGDEVRVGARRQSNWNQDFNRDGRVDHVDSQIAQRYRGYDMNNDNRVGRSEWPGEARLFTRLDANRDGYLTIREYVDGGGANLDSQGGAPYRFANIDSNSDGWISRNEWNMGRADFDRFDVNNDNRLSRFEFENSATAGGSTTFDRFADVDRNRDGWLTRSEWRGTEVVFTRLDRNRDNRLSRSEYDAQVTTESVTTESERSAAWRTGYDRGIQEGRAAGREDFVRNHGWDLEGQRELERADSGYTPQVGSLSDYQAGYREGFRAAYRAGFDEARDRR